MIQLDEKHWVNCTSEVRAIRPMWIPSPDRADDRRPSILDPERCMVLVGGDWLIIERGPEAIAGLINNSPAS